MDKLILYNEVGVEKFAAIVSDNADDYAAARKQIPEKYEHIFNVRCIAHCLNLISHDIIKYTSTVYPDAYRIIRFCGLTDKSDR